MAALADRCPLLVVLGADLLNHGRLPETVTDETAFRERVFKGFRDEFLRSIPSDRKERVGRLIQFLSLVTPAPQEDRLVDLAAGVLGCSALDIAEDIDALQAAGLVVENREGIRLYPDLFADAVLLDACLDFSGRPSRLHREIIARLPAREFPSLMRNLAQADWATRTRMRTRAPLFQPVWKSFLQRFRAATWEPKLRFPFGDAGNALGFLDGLDVQQQPVREQEDREALLGEWASVALFLPENTLELARLAMSMMADPDAGGTGQPAKAPDSSRAAVSRALPRLLGPLVVWHPDYAAAALEILWSLDSEELPENRPCDANGIGAIAAAATFEFDKPLSATQSVIDWLSVKLLEPGAIERLQREPWILSAPLKPFFCREVERHWSAGRTVHFSSLPVSLDRVRPLRQAALGLVERFFGAGQLALAHAVIPAVEEAIMPCCGRFGRKVTEQEQEAWRAERLAALRVIETAIELHKDSPSLLIRLRRTLWRCIEADPDPSLVAECRRTHARIPDGFSLRVARLLTSWPTDELDVRSGSDLNVGVTEAERQWEAF
ncbi:MAG: hypothetical protein KDM81_13255, partial [Verrucomicrobiae bacterium]|nr:hypothetical protein [Verrucomicrobiae bacterium]